MLTCPECQTEQSSQAPFCENCGFRIRRHDTVREGIEAISEQMLAEHRRRANPDASGAMKSVSTLREFPSARAARRPQQREESSTMVEGLPAVSAVDRSAEEARSLEESTGTETPVPAELPTERSGLYTGPLPSTTSRNRLALFGIVWFALTATGVLVAYFLITARADSGDAAPATAAEASRKIPIDAGPYRRGLDEEVRSFILQSCAKVEDDPEERCEQDKLLKGEFPQTTVEVAAYAIDSKEVTVARFQACVDAGACEEINYRDCAVWTPQGLQIALRVPKALREPERPVVCVTRPQAQAFCEWSGGALPSHDQWEKAARGADALLFPWGDSWSSDLANWGEMDLARTHVAGKLDGFEWTAPPGHYPDGASPTGALDMAGNVAEWVRGDDPLSGHARGGSWISNPFDLRTTNRLALDTDTRRTDVGFRCAYE